MFFWRPVTTRRWASGSPGPWAREWPTRPGGPSRSLATGAFQMTGTELATMVDAGLRPIVLLLNNNSYGMLEALDSPRSYYHRRPWGLSWLLPGPGIHRRASGDGRRTRSRDRSSRGRRGSLPDRGDRRPRRPFSVPLPDQGAPGRSENAPRWSWADIEMRKRRSSAPRDLAIEDLAAEPGQSAQPARRTCLALARRRRRVRRRCLIQSEPNFQGRIAHRGQTQARFPLAAQSLHREFSPSSSVHKTATTSLDQCRGSY